MKYVENFFKSGKEKTQEMCPFWLSLFSFHHYYVKDDFVLTDDNDNDFLSKHSQK